MSRAAVDILPPWRIECAGLRAARGGREVLRGIDLQIASGECISLIGPNGAGKTTLLLTLLGLLPPSAGSVTVNGRAMHSLPAGVRGRFATFMPQSLERLPAFRVFDVVAGGRFPHVTAMRPLSQHDVQIVRDALRRCGIEGLSDRSVTQLSGGERQKTLLAAAIAQQASLFCLDEPDTALDPAYQAELVRLLRSLRNEGRAIVMISHDLQLPSALGGRVVALRDGRLAADGPAQEVLTPDHLAPIFDAAFIAAATADGRRVALPRL